MTSPEPASAGALQSQADLPGLAVTKPEALGTAAVKSLQQKFKATGPDLRRDPARVKADGAIKRFFKAFQKADYQQAALRALDAIEADQSYAFGYHSMGLALEKLGELYKAVQFFEKALALDPHDPDIYHNLGNTAWRVEMYEGAERLFRIFIELQPDNPQGYNNLASVLRDQGRFDEALETARSAIYALPDYPHLWNTVGTILLERGDADECHTFFDEALRLDPKFPLALHNKAFAAFNVGDFDTALPLWRRAFKRFAHDPARRAEVGHGIGHCLLAMGDLEEGWKNWGYRHDPNFRTTTLFGLAAPRWDGGDIAGKRVLAIGEQGIGDEIMFANALPELIERVGPDGRVLIAVESRLVPLFRRAFPGQLVGPLQVTRHNGKLVRLVPWLESEAPIDVYTPFGDTIGMFRRRIEDFPADRRILAPDPTAVAHWRERLDRLGPGPKIGVCWRSGHLTVARRKFYCPLEHWGPGFSTPGVTWINLQYDDCAEDKDRIGTAFGAQIADFDDLDLRNDLDGNAALCAALDLVISAPTAAAGLAGAVGTKTWVLSNVNLWPTLATDRYPWYPDTQFFRPDGFGQWGSLMTRLGDALAAYLETRSAA